MANYGHQKRPLCRSLVVLLHSSLYKSLIVLKKGRHGPQDGHGCQLFVAALVMKSNSVVSCLPSVSTPFPSWKTELKPCDMSFSHSSSCFKWVLLLPPTIWFFGKARVCADVRTPHPNLEFALEDINNKRRE